jgi:hypothetical protein
LSRIGLIGLGRCMIKIKSNLPLLGRVWFANGRCVFTRKMTVGERSTRSPTAGCVWFYTDRSILPVTNGFANGSNRTSPGPLSRPFPTGRPHHRREKMMPNAPPDAQRKQLLENCHSTSNCFFFKDTCPNLNATSAPEMNLHEGAPELLLRSFRRSFHAKEKLTTPT